MTKNYFFKYPVSLTLYFYYTVYFFKYKKFIISNNFINILYCRNVA